jgi:hypothetical protein
MRWTLVYGMRLAWLKEHQLCAPPCLRLPCLLSLNRIMHNRLQALVELD